MKLAKKMRIAVATLSIASLGLVAGCSAAHAIGNGDDGAASFTLKNDTGQVVSEFSVDATRNGTFFALVQENDLGVDDEATVYVPGDATAKSDIKVTMADGLSYEIDDVDLNDVRDAQLKTDGVEVYLIYTSAASGQEVDTLALAKAAAETAAAEKGAANKKAAEKKAAAEKVAAKKKAADEKKAVEEKAAAEKAAAEKKAAEKKSAAEAKMKAEEQKKAEAKKKADAAKKKAEAKKKADAAKKKAEAKKKAQEAAGDKKQESCDNFEL